MLIWVTSVYYPVEFGFNVVLSLVSSSLSPELSFLTQVPSCTFISTVDDSVGSGRLSGVYLIPKKGLVPELSCEERRPFTFPPGIVALPLPT